MCKNQCGRITHHDLRQWFKGHLELEVGHLEDMESERAESTWLLAQERKPQTFHTTALGPGKTPQPAFRAQLWLHHRCWNPQGKEITFLWHVHKAIVISLFKKWKTINAPCCCAVLSDSAAPCTVAHQAPQFMKLFRQEYWSSLPFSTPRALPNPGIKPISLVPPALANRFFNTIPSGKTNQLTVYSLKLNGMNTCVV